MNIKISPIIHKLNLVSNWGFCSNKKTEAEISINEGNLIVSFLINGKSYKSYGDNFNDKLYKGDVVEIFITIDSLDKYLEIEVNPNNIQFAGIVNFKNGKKQLKLLDYCPFASYVKPTSNGYKTTLSIPIKTLLGLGLNPNNCYFNLYQQKFNKIGFPKLYALSPTKSFSFHKPNSFIKLTFNDNLSK